MANTPTPWVSDKVRNEISILGLVASDAAYNSGGFGEGAPLQSFPDNKLSEEYPFPALLLSQMGEQGTDPSSPLAYELTSGGKGRRPCKAWHSPHAGR